MSKSLYTVDHNCEASITVEIDHEILTEERLAEINNFWSGALERYEKEDSLLDVVLKMLCVKCLILELLSNFNVNGIISMFDWDELGGGQEGWPKMDGSHGIKLISINGFSFDHDLIEIEEVKSCQET